MVEPMSSSGADELVQNFQRSVEFQRLQQDLMDEFLESDGAAAVRASVEKLIATDLEANPRLLDALVSTNSDDSVSEGRLTAMFERRIRSEVEAGMTGKPFDEFLQPKREELARKVLLAMNRDQREAVNR